jgi:hypothetical protein
MPQLCVQGNRGAEENLQRKIVYQALKQLKHAVETKKPYRWNGRAGQRILSTLVKCLRDH